MLQCQGVKMSSETKLFKLILLALDFLKLKSEKTLTFLTFSIIFFMFLPPGLVPGGRQKPGKIQGFRQFRLFLAFEHVKNLRKLTFLIK